MNRLWPLLNYITGLMLTLAVKMLGENLFYFLTTHTLFFFMKYMAGNVKIMWRITGRKVKNSSVNHQLFSEDISFKTNSSS